jgi:hypothetical protein
MITIMTAEGAMAGDMTTSFIAITGSHYATPIEH